MPRFPRVERNISVDVVVVGGGISGLTAAYLLAREGQSVALVERDRCAQVDTGHTTAHLTMVTDEHLVNLAAQHGRNHAQAAWDAGLAAIAQVDAIVREEEIDCGFEWVPGFLHRALARPGRDAVDPREEAAMAAELGFDATYVRDVPLVGGGGVRYEDQGRFHPRRYLAGLARAIEAHGGRIFEHSAAGQFSADPFALTVNGHSISCDSIVIATHNPLMGNTGITSAALFQTKLALYTSYVVSGRVKKGTVPDALWWDLGRPYFYLRIDPHRDFDEVIFGGEDHKTGQVTDTEACYERVTQMLEPLVPQVELTHRWSGQVIETHDGLPYIGETAAHQFVATGFSGNGMTFGTLGGIMACDWALGRRNPWSDLFDPARKKIRGAAWDYLVENKDYPYYMLRDRFAGAAGRSLRAVRRGEGKILEKGGERVAAYRADDGSVVIRSSICTHMGCTVAWNTAERTWDCPCHGSRFKPDGSVISGPAESPLPEK